MSGETHGSAGLPAPLVSTRDERSKDQSSCRPPAANPHRGEAEIVVGGRRLVLRPSFEALVAAEGELGSLFALVERAADGQLGLNEIAGLFWHVVRDRPDGLTREDVGAMMVEMGLARTTPVLRVVLRQVLEGA